MNQITINLEKGLYGCLEQLCETYGWDVEEGVRMAIKTAYMEMLMKENTDTIRKDKVSTSYSLPEELVAKVKRLADTRCASSASIIRQIITNVMYYYDHDKATIMPMLDYDPKYHSCPKKRIGVTLLTAMWNKYKEFCVEVDMEQSHVLTALLDYQFKEIL